MAKNKKTKSLNKYISERGLCSRREADEWISQGRVQLNGELAKKGNRVGKKDVVTLDGKPLPKKPDVVYLALHKPAGVTSTTDLDDPDNIIDYMDYPKRIFPVGRLDKASTGLLLLTNDGDIVNEILREENEHEKIYIVKVHKPITPQFLNRMAAGVEILDQFTKPCLIEKLHPNLFKITLTQGLNRQIRRMCEKLGYRVLTLKRVRIMNIKLGDLEPGEYRDLTDQEIQKLRSQISHKATS
ncbi:MAG: pseudouridine synthase [Saprospiraceae bacterium]|nr:pseudouridine synthase [Saprospiraceae bacterium]